MEMHAHSQLKAALVLASPGWPMCGHDEVCDTLVQFEAPGELELDPFLLCLYRADAGSRLGKLFCSVWGSFHTAKTKCPQKPPKGETVFWFIRALTHIVVGKAWWMNS